MANHNLLKIALYGQFLLLGSCSVKNKIRSEYILKNNSPLAQTSLRLNKDSSFVASSFNEVGGAFESRGRWRIQADTLLLNIDRENAPYTTRLKNDPSLKYLKIEIRQKKDSSLLKFSKVYVNGEILNPQNDGTFTSRSGDVKKIEAEYLGNKYEIPLTLRNDNYLVVYFDLKNRPNGLSLSNKWLIKTNKLTALDGSGMTFKFNRNLN